MKKLIQGLCAAAAAALLAGSAQAALTSFQTYTGHYGISSDGWGSVNQRGTISAFVPDGATVVAAYLYTSTFDNPSLGGVGGTLGGTTLGAWTSLGTNSDACCSLTAARQDVTSIVKPAIDGGTLGTYDFTVTETSSSQDGYALVVIYELASLATSTVGIMDGFARVSGDTTTIAFGDPLDPSAPGFFAEMRLGIGFSYDGNTCSTSDQVSRVTVNGTTITNNSGCNDDSADAIASNGNLITVGGSDDPFSAHLPSTANDHERYNLISYLSDGDTSITITNFNASANDNIFLAMFHVLGEANVCSENCSVPEPATLAMVGLALAGLGGLRRRRSGIARH